VALGARGRTVGRSQLTQSRPAANLTDVWHGRCRDLYLRQIDGNTPWWLGLSQDQGRSFANVFQGTFHGNTIAGDWTDIPIGVAGARASGRLTLIGDPDVPLPAVTTLAGR
jgi:hypothetical protein